MARKGHSGHSCVSVKYVYLGWVRKDFKWIFLIDSPLERFERNSKTKDEINAKVRDKDKSRFTLGKLPQIFRLILNHKTFGIIGELNSSSRENKSSIFKTKHKATNKCF